MRLIFRKHHLLLCLSLASGLCLSGSSMALEQQATEPMIDSQAFDRQTLEAQLDQLMLLIGEIGQRDPVPQLEYDQAKLLAEGLLKESRRPGFFWTKVPVETGIGLEELPVYDSFSTHLGELNSIAMRVSRTDRVTLAGDHHDFIVRLFRDQETRRLQLVDLDGQEMLKRSIGFGLYRQRSKLDVLRWYLRSENLISPEDWLLVINGLLWEGPQHLVWRDDISFASLESLQQSGAQIVARGGTVIMSNRAQRLDLPIVNSMDPSGRSAYRDMGGRIYVPVEETARRKVAAVSTSPDPKNRTDMVFVGSQTVVINTRVDPRDIGPPERSRLLQSELGTSPAR